MTNHKKLVYFLLILSATFTGSAAFFADSPEQRFMALQGFGSNILAAAVTLIKPNDDNSGNIY